MKIIFLDIDGVMNSAQSDHYHNAERYLSRRMKLWLYNKIIHYFFDWMPDPLRLFHYTAELRIWIMMLLTNHRKFCPIAVSNLKYLLESDKDVYIVISSTWRLSGLLYMRTMMKLNNIDPRRVVGITPRNGENLDGSRPVDDGRGHQVQAWLNRHKDEVKEFVVIDDDSHDMFHMREHLVHTDSNEGFMWEKAMDVAKRLNIDFDAKVSLK